MKFLKTFRVRLLIILAILLVATLVVQYYLNLRAENQNSQLREKQQQALVAGIMLGSYSVTSDSRLKELRDSQPFFDENANRQIKEILVINSNWEISDSLNHKEYLPTIDDAGKTYAVMLKDIKDLPPLANADRLGNDGAKFPNAVPHDETSDAEAHAIPIETSDGRWYVMVMLKTDKAEAARRAAQPLVYMLFVLLLSTLVTFLLVWRFTTPVANLSEAAREVAHGNLSVRVPDAGRHDEMGILTARFNEMTAELAKKAELEDKLQEAEKSAVVGRLGSAIAHEIRNPLNYINLTLDHLRAKFKPEDAESRATFEKLTTQLKAEVARINKQITDFLSYSRPLKMTIEPTDVVEVVKNSLRLVEAQAREQKIEIDLEAEENLPPILGDGEFLRSVFSNLFINAVQAMEVEGGKLGIKIYIENNFVKTEITDTGTGIPPENIEKIFEPYFSTKETGTGLGLAIVKKVIDDHSGAISAASKENEGTKFTVEIPTAEK